MSKWYHDSDKLKSVFDGVAHYILCGVVCYTGVYTILKDNSFIYLNYFYDFIGFVIVVAAFYLFHANTSHLKHKVIKLHALIGWKFHLANLMFSFVHIFGYILLLNEALKIPIGGITLADFDIMNLIYSSP
ncbi:hypothetical protein FKF78_01825 [Aeromonas hydrophila]|uniref:hypothetical protein n=1 Tax=Aeromonas hydrophila TaxID=644 RepID=UPI0035A36A8C|nr:hypothetical protein [Aeromonas hydrophila]